MSRQFDLSKLSPPIKCAFPKKRNGWDSEKQKNDYWHQWEWLSDEKKNLQRLFEKQHLEDQLKEKENNCCSNKRQKIDSAMKKKVSVATPRLSPISSAEKKKEAVESPVGSTVTKLIVDSNGFTLSSPDSDTTLSVEEFVAGYEKHLKDQYEDDMMMLADAAVASMPTDCLSISTQPHPGSPDVDDLTTPPKIYSYEADDSIESWEKAVLHEEACNFCEQNPCVMDEMNDQFFQQVDYIKESGLDDGTIEGRCECRKVMYRFFARLLKGYMGKGNRMKMPGCAENNIHAQFPAPDGKYMGHKDA